MRHAENRGGGIDGATCGLRRRVAPALQGVGGPGYTCCALSIDRGFFNTIGGYLTVITVSSCCGHWDVGKTLRLSSGAECNKQSATDHADTAKDDVPHRLIREVAGQGVGNLLYRRPGSMIGEPQQHPPNYQQHCPK